MPSLRFRYFISESLAFRLNFAIDAAKSNVDFGTKTDITGSSSSLTGSTSISGSTTPAAYKLTSNRFMVAIAPGLEIHKGISERLSVYYGAYIDFAMQSAKGKITGTPGSRTVSSTTSPATGAPTTVTITESSVAGEYSYEVKGQNLGDDLSDLTSPTTDFAVTATGDVTSPSFGTTSTGNDLRANGNRAFTRLGLIGVLGADYYITKGLYLGLEVSWGYTNYMYKKVTVDEKITDINTSTTTTTTGAPVINPTTPDPVITYSNKVEENKDNNWNITPAVNAAFRFGFWF
jgi:hypothetical protein